jgi:hypothetical protein
MLGSGGKVLGFSRNSATWTRILGSVRLYLRNGWILGKKKRVTNDAHLRNFG